MEKKNFSIAICRISIMLFVSMMITSCHHVIDGIEYEITGDSTVSVQKLEDKSLTEIIIPSKVVFNDKEYNVTSICESAFHSADIRQIKLPCTIKTIGKEAFEFCSNLEIVYFSEGLERIEEEAFNLCERLTNVVLPTSVIRIEQRAFSRCNLLSFTFPSSITFVGDLVLEDNSDLSVVKMPNCIQNFGDGVFAGCKNLSQINIINTKNINNGFRTIYGNNNETLLLNGDTLITVYPQNITDIKLSQYISFIKGAAFCSFNSLKQIDLSQTRIPSLEDNLFHGCDSLISVVVPSSVNKIGDYCFRYCRNLMTIEIPKGTDVKIGENAFEDCYNYEIVRTDHEVNDDSARKLINNIIDNHNTILRSQSKECEKFIKENCTQKLIKKLLDLKKEYNDYHKDDEVKAYGTHIFYRGNPESISDEFRILDICKISPNEYQYEYLDKGVKAISQIRIISVNGKLLIDDVKLIKDYMPRKEIKYQQYGRSAVAGSVPCYKCGGTGQYAQRGGGMVLGYITCPFCNGSGTQILIKR